MKHMLESRLLGEISITSDTEMTPPLESEEELKSLLMKMKEEKKKKKMKEENEKVGLKQHSEN